MKTGRLSEPVTPHTTRPDVTGKKSSVVHLLGRKTDMGEIELCNMVLFMIDLALV